MNRTLWRLIKIAVFEKWWMILAALLGFLTIGSAIGLLMTSAYIIAKAALHPSIAPYPYLYSWRWQYRLSMHVSFELEIGSAYA